MFFSKSIVSLIATLSISNFLDSFSLKTVVTIKKKSNINTISGNAAVEIAGSFLFLPFENLDIITFIELIYFFLSLSF